MDRLTAMTVFVEVAERGSLTAAAEVMDMSRAMVSRYLAEVEAWLGALMQGRLYERDIYAEKFITAADAGKPRSAFFKRV